MPVTRLQWDEHLSAWFELCARSRWAAAESYWGLWRIPQSRLPVLPADVASAAAVELGCGGGYVSAWLARRGARPVGVDVAAAPSATPHPTRLTPQRGVGPALTRIAGPHIVVPLTQGNLTHDHVYLRAHLNFFPADAIGAPNARDGTGTMLTLHLEGLPGPIRTDIAADKKTFRCRGAWRDFFKRHHLQPGDQLVIERLSAYEYLVHCAR